MVAGLRAFAFNQSSAAKAGGVYGNGGSCAQRLVFGAWAVDALTVATSYKNAGKQNCHERATPNHRSAPMRLFLLPLVRAQLFRLFARREMCLSVVPFMPACSHRFLLGN